MFSDNHKPFREPDDPYAFKANYDANQKKLQSEGVPGLWRQVSNLLILVGILGVIVLLIYIF